MFKCDVAVIGTACCDIIFYGLPSFPKLGEEIWTEGVVVTAGGAINTPAAFSRLGLKVGLATPLGQDFFGRFILSKMKEERIALDLVQFIDGAYPQVSVALNYARDRAFVSYAEQKEAKRLFEHLHRVVEQTDARLFHFYTSSEPGHTNLMRKAKKFGKLISLDSGWDPEWLQSEEIKEQIKLADVFLPNLKEAQMITGKQEVEEVLSVLSSLTSTVVVKLGDKGAVCQANGKVFRSEAFYTEPIDSTGAGDCFVAGFLHSWLNHWDIDRCLQVANLCGSASVSAVGGFAGAPTKNQLYDMLSRKVQNI